jgi:hypothetical protein
MVDAYLACRKMMPKWHGMDDMESIFWQFVYTVIGQIDSRPQNERVREGEHENPTQHCKHVSMGQYKVTTGTNKGYLKSKQARCKYCKTRKKNAKEAGVSPPTCYHCSFHDVAVCRKFNCWERHLAEVRQNQRDGFEI